GYIPLRDPIDRSGNSLCILFMSICHLPNPARVHPFKGPNRPLWQLSVYSLYVNLPSTQSRKGISL
ncbi:MAG: hypothetical protein AAF694_30390, partial [Bacteroidota bacterium]